MNNHPYLRAYMAGISVPTPILLVMLTVFIIARFVFQVPVPIERVIIFPMAVVPNLFGFWNMVHQATRSRTHLPLGIHGAILPFLLVPAGFLLARGLGFVEATGHGVNYFGAFEVGYAVEALSFAVAVIIYYLVWKYLIGFFNQVLGIAE